MKEEKKLCNKREIIEGLRKAVVKYDEESSQKLAKKALESGIDPLEAIEEGLVKGITEVGEKFSAKEIFLPELVVAADACLAGIEVLKPQLSAKNRIEPLGKVVLGTVYGDIHFIGKNLVATMLKANGFEVYDIGEDQPVEAFVAKVKEVDADIVGASALTSTTRFEQEKIVKAFKKEGLKTRIMIGGAVVDAAWAEITGSDGYADNLQDAVNLAKQLANITKEKAAS
jgi:corrinoid protein of di/trimethylamine methyltransferase